MIKIFLQSATDVRTDVCSWFAIDQMYCTVFNLTSLKFHDLTTGLETKWYRRMFLASVLGGESCSKTNWLPNENQKANSTTPQPHSYSGQKPQITQPKKPTFLFVPSSAAGLPARLIWIYFTYQSFAITDAWEIGVISTIVNVPDTNSYTVLSPRLKCFSFIKTAAFKTLSGKPYYVNYWSSPVAWKRNLKELKLINTPGFEMCFEKPSMSEEDISTVVIDGSLSDI